MSIYSLLRNIPQRKTKYIHSGLQSYNVGIRYFNFKQEHCSVSQAPQNGFAPGRTGCKEGDGN